MDNVFKELDNQKQECEEEIAKLEAYKSSLVEQSKNLQAQFNASIARINELRGELEGLDKLYKRIIETTSENNSDNKASNSKGNSKSPKKIVEPEPEQNNKLSDSEKAAVNSINNVVSQQHKQDNDLPDYLKQ